VAGLEVESLADLMRLNIYVQIYITTVEKIANTLTPTNGKTRFVNDFKLPPRYE
jgi:hypothetical protein